MPNRNTAPKTFLDLYNISIAPKLREIDIFLKELEFPATIWQVSQLLDMPYNDVSELVHSLKIENLDYNSIFILIKSGTSPICRLIQREIERGYPIYYTPDDISIIYDINVKKIKSVFETLGVIKVKGSCLPFIFDMLPANVSEHCN